MYPSPSLSGDVVNTARAVLDAVGVPGRLRHVRDFVWREGNLTFRVDDGGVAYELRAEWNVARLEPTDAGGGLERRDSVVVEGRWTLGQAGYVLRVGIDFNVPSALYIRTSRTLACVPFVGRPPAQVETALAADLSAYVDSFLTRCQAVPQARASAAATIARLHVSVAPASDRG
jgi:hypothetical protein